MWLKAGVERRKEHLINRLIHKFGYTKCLNGRQLYELTLTELEHIHIRKMAEQGQRMNVTYK
ncbi:Fur-regulated basic protein FbpA [Priestia filamentosa]|uniref:Fur-regulated basic protein FbpA n=1 Tax=Priestia filamentosa TaxID=1402861 RepID=UPI0039828B9F